MSDIEIGPDCYIEYRKMLNEAFYSFLIFKINYNKKRVEVKQKVLAGASFKEFKASLTADKFDCQFALYYHELAKPVRAEPEPAKEEVKEEEKKAEEDDGFATTVVKAEKPKLLMEEEKKVEVEAKEEDFESKEMKMKRVKIVLVVFKPLCAMAGNKIKYNEATEMLDSKLPRKFSKIMHLSDKDEIT